MINYKKSSVALYFQFGNILRTHTKDQGFPPIFKLKSNLYRFIW